MSEESVERGPRYWIREFGAFVAAAVITVFVATVVYPVDPLNIALGLLAAFVLFIWLTRSSRREQHE